MISYTQMDEPSFDGLWKLNSIEEHTPSSREHTQSENGRTLVSYDETACDTSMFYGDKFFSDDQDMIVLNHSDEKKEYTFKLQT